MTEYFKIGKFVAVFGLQGELVLKHNLGKKSSLKGLQTLFIEDKKDSFLPWFVEATRIKSDDEIYVLLEGVSAREKAAPLTQKEVWMAEPDFKKFAARSAPINLLGYTIIQAGETLGTVDEVIEQPHQVLCRIQYKGKEAYIPLHDQTLEKIDNKGRCVSVSLPPGLLEVYL